MRLGSDLGALLFASGGFVTKVRAEVAVCNGRPWGAHADQCVDCNVMLTHPGVFHTCV